MHVHWSVYLTIYIMNQWMNFNETERVIQYLSIHLQLNNFWSSHSEATLAKIKITPSQSVLGILI